MATIVGALAVELGLDTAQFERSLKTLPGMSQQHFGAMSAEMKRTSREGAESFRLIDEALGIHLSRPITRILTQEFPGLAKGLQSVLGAGLTGAIAVAAFEFLSSAVDKLIKKFDEAKKAQEEYEAANRHLQETMQDVAIAHEKRIAQFNAEIAAASGDKSGELANKLKVASIDDAELGIRDLDRIAEAMERVSKAALEAETSSHRFWLAVGRANTSEHNLTIADSAKQFDDFKEKLRAASKEDATQGTRVGLDLAIQKTKELDAAMAEANAHRISDLRAFGDDFLKAFYFIPARSGYTDKERSQITSQDTELHAFIESQKHSTEEHEKHSQVLRQQSAATADPGEKEIEKLKAETAAQLALAGAAGESVAAQRLQQACGEADQIISRILEEAHGRLTSKMKEEILTVHALTAERQFAKDAVQASQEIDKRIEQVREQIAANKELASSYLEGGEAVLKAQVDQKLAPEIIIAKQLRDQYELLKKAADDYAESVRKLGGAVGPKPGLDIPPERLAAAKADADRQDQKVSGLRTLATTEELTKYKSELDLAQGDLEREQPLLERLNAAYLENAQAVRKAQVELAFFHWEQSHRGQTVEQATETLAKSVHPNISSKEALDVLSSPTANGDELIAAQARARLDQIAEVSAQLEQQSIQQQRLADVELASRYSITRTYDDEINKLTRAREVMQQYGQSTLLIDAEMQTAQERLIKQWDDAALKVGNFGDKTRAIFNEMVIQGQHAGEEIAKAFGSAIDGANAQLAKLLTGQKTDFKAVISNLSEQVTKAEIGKLEGSLLQSLGFGDLAKSITQGKPDGTKNNPLHVRNVDGVPAATNSPLNSLNPFANNLLNQSGNAGEANPFAGLASLFSGNTSQNSPLGSISSLFSSKSSTSSTSAEIRAHIVNWPPALLAGPGATAGSQSPLALAAATGAGETGAGIPGLGGAEGILGSLFGGFLAAGGDVKSDTHYVVGEHGPELFRSATAGEIIPNHELAKYFQGTHIHGNQIGETKIGETKTDAKTTVGAGLPGLSGADGILGSVFGGFMAAGGDVKADTHYIVGEHGPELFRASTAGEIIPNHKLASHLLSNPNAAWTFDPSAAYAQPYERYERWLHRGDLGGGGTLKSLLSLGATALFKYKNPFKELQSLLHHAPTAASTATDIGGVGALAGGGFGAGIGSGVDPSSLSKSNFDFASIPDFAGFMADGGDVTPGKRYIVGDRGPELLRIPGAENLGAMSNSDSRSWSNRGGDHNNSTHITQNFNGADTGDLFKRTVRQEYARMFRNLK